MAEQLESSLYDRIGGKPALQKLVTHFYDTMESHPEVQGIRAQHKADLAEAREKLFEFLSGWCGGPNLYIEKHGHPRLRARHLPFPIGESERDQWMLCFDQALNHAEIKGLDREVFRSAIARLADHMRNIPTTP